MFRNTAWDRPEDWETFTSDTKKRWNELADIFELFYKDMRKTRHINTALSSYATPDETQSFNNFIKILEDQNKVSNSTNMLGAIALSNDGSRGFVERNRDLISEKYLPYLYLSQFCFSLIQNYEMFHNIIKKTLVADKLRNKKREPLNKSITEIPLDSLFDLLKKDSVQSDFMKKIALENKSLRNGISHSLFWYEEKQFCWVEDIESAEGRSIPFNELIERVSEQSMNLQCLIWVVAYLIKKRFFYP